MLEEYKTTMMKMTMTITHNSDQLESKSTQQHDFYPILYNSALVLLYIHIYFKFGSRKTLLSDMHHTERDLTFWQMAC